MDSRLRLLGTITSASVLVTLGEWALALSVRMKLTLVQEQILVVVFALLPSSLAAWWLFEDFSGSIRGVNLETSQLRLPCTRPCLQ